MNHVCVVNDVIVMHVTVNDVIVSCCWGMTLTICMRVHSYTVNDIHDICQSAMYAQ